MGKQIEDSGIETANGNGSNGSMSTSSDESDLSEDEHVANPFEECLVDNEDTGVADIEDVIPDALTEKRKRLARMK